MALSNCYTRKLIICYYVLFNFCRVSFFEGSRLDFFNYTTSTKHTRFFFLPTFFIWFFRVIFNFIRVFVLSGDAGRLAIEQFLEGNGTIDALLPMENNEDPDSDEEQEDRDQESEESSSSESEADETVETVNTSLRPAQDTDDDDIQVLESSPSVTKPAAVTTGEKATIIQAPVIPVSVSYLISVNDHIVKLYF